MTQMALPWWSKVSSGTTSCEADALSTSSNSENAITNSCGLSRLMRKLKKRSKMLCPPSRQSSFQCRYDPMSYSLNFDTSGSGNLLDEDYYKFYAFSSRFVATPRTDCQRVPIS